MRYLDPAAFRGHSIEVLPFQVRGSGIWASAREVSAVHALMLVGPGALGREMEARADGSLSTIPDLVPNPAGLWRSVRTPRHAGLMALRFLGKDPDSPNGDSPTV